MRKHIKKPMKPLRLNGLPEDLRKDLKEARLALGLSQQELGARIGLPQMHISGIESGKIVPRFDTLLDVVRALDYDLLLIPRVVVPAVQALVGDYRNSAAGRADEERSLYADDAEQSQSGDRRRDEI
jgi:transcriptional regulator with XRE-family HTH domain